MFVWKVQVFKSRSMSRFLDYTAQQKSWSTLIWSGITKWLSTRALPGKAELLNLAYLLGLQAAGSMWRCPCCTLLKILGSSNSVIEGLDLLVQECFWLLFLSVFLCLDFIEELSNTAQAYILESFFLQLEIKATSQIQSELYTFWFELAIQT